jgi:hypothetical protein
VRLLIFEKELYNVEFKPLWCTYANQFSDVTYLCSDNPIPIQADLSHFFQSRYVLSFMFKYMLPVTVLCEIRVWEGNTFPADDHMSEELYI